MTSVAMLLKYFGADVNPGRLNSWLQSRGGDLNCLIYWGTAANYYPGVTDEGNISTTDKTRVRQELNAGYPVIVGVNNNGHDVVVTSYSGRTTLASYGNTISRIVIYHGPTNIPGGTDSNAVNYNPDATGRMMGVVSIFHLTNMRVFLSMNHIIN